MTTSESPTHPDAPRAGGETPGLTATESLQELQWKRGQYYHAERDASTALLRAQRAYEDAAWALRWIDKRIAALEAAPQPSHSRWPIP